jgi:hypothetical protein
MMNRHRDTERLYDILDRLSVTIGGPRRLDTCTGTSCAWPSHGLYFFFEPGQYRRDGVAPRVVRVGTHALTLTSQTTLWNRLSQHRGQVRGRNPGGGNHRGSIFRRHVGAALIRRADHPSGLLDSWFSDSALPEWAEQEAAIERDVSRYVGAMPFLWLSVPSRPDRTSDRGYLERSAIGLLSTLAGGIDPASDNWLGRHAVSLKITGSGLWNVNHVDEPDAPDFLNLLDRHVDGMRRPA